jgi:hypothetical protein
MQLDCKNSSTAQSRLAHIESRLGGFHIDSNFVRIVSGTTRIDVRRAEFWPLMELMSAAAVRLGEVLAAERRDGKTRNGCSE